MARGEATKRHVRNKEQHVPSRIHRARVTRDHMIVSRFSLNSYVFGTAYNTRQLSRERKSVSSGNPFYYLIQTPLFPRSLCNQRIIGLIIVDRFFENCTRELQEQWFIRFSARLANISPEGLKLIVYFSFKSLSTFKAITASSTVQSSEVKWSECEVRPTRDDDWMPRRPDGCGRDAATDLDRVGRRRISTCSAGRISIQTLTKRICSEHTIYRLNRIDCNENIVIKGTTPEKI